MSIYCYISARARGYVIGRGVYNYIVIYLQKKIRTFFLSFKNTHFQTPISTQEGFSSNLIASCMPWQLQKPSCPVQILLVCRLGTGSASSETQTLTRSKPHCMLHARYAYLARCIGHTQSTGLHLKRSMGDCRAVSVTYDF